MGLAGIDKALQFRDIVHAFVDQRLETQRPKYRYATVQSYDRVLRKCTVRYAGDTVDSVIGMGSVQPNSIGQIVRVEGFAGDRFVADIMGPAYIEESALNARVGVLEQNGTYLGNLLGNGDYETWPASPTAQEPVGWNMFWSGGTRTGSRDNVNYYRGANSWKVAFGNDSPFVRCQSDVFRVKGGDVVVCKFMARTSHIAGVFDIMLQSNDDANQPQFFSTGTVQQGMPQVALGAIDTWQEVKVQFVIPPTHTQARMTCVATGSTTAMNVWIDSASLHVASISPSLVVPTWTNLTLQNSWVFYGAPFAVPAYIKSNGWVEVKGLVKNGVVTVGTVIAQLPAGCRPAATRAFANDSASGHCRIDVDASGNLICSTGANASHMFLDNIKFFAEQ